MGTGDPAPSEGANVASLQRAGTLERLARAGSTLGIQRAGTLPTNDEDLQHAAMQPGFHDIATERPCCGGMWKLQQMIGFLIGTALMFFITLLKPIKDYPYANPMLGISLLCGCFWVFEAVPIYITGLLPMIMMPIFEISSSDVAAKAYWNQVQLLIISTYTVGLALEQVQLPRRVSLQVLVTVGVVNPALMLLGFMSMCFFLSMFCNSIAVTLMITPFAISLMNAAEEQALSMQAETSSSEESGSDSAEDSTIRTLGNGYIDEVRRFGDGILLGIAYASTCGGITSLTGAIPNEVMTGIAGVGGQLSYQSWMCFAFPTAAASVTICFVVIYFRYMRGLVVHSITQEILEVEIQEFKREHGETMSRDEILVLILQLLQFSLLFLRPWLANKVTTQYGEVLLGDATLAVIPVILLFLLPSKRRKGQSLLTWQRVHTKFDFGLILLVGGAFAIADGFKQSGLNIALGQGISNLTHSQDTFGLTLTIVIISTISTQVFSAVGTAGTLLPSLNAAAQNDLKSPLSLLLPAAVACSFAFMLPTAAPGNVVVLAKSQDLGRPLRVRDFFLTGGLVSLTVIFVGAFLIQIMQNAVFDANEPYPQWACDGVGCVWVDVPGVVHGRTVMAQACTPDKQIETCTLANGTAISLTDDVIDPVG